MPNKNSLLDSFQYLEIRKANDLIQKCRSDLTLQQQIILLFLLLQIKPTDNEFHVISFSILDYCLFNGMNPNSGQNYKLIKKQIKDISEKTIRLDCPDGEKTLHLLHIIDMQYGTGLIDVRFSDDLVPYLLRLYDHYTCINPIYIVRFQSKYALRLYEYVKSIHYNDENEYTYPALLNVPQISRILGADNYTDYKELNRRVIAPAVREINQYSDKTVTLEPKKYLRKVIGFQMTIETKSLSERVTLCNETEKYLCSKNRDQFERPFC